MSKLRRCVCSHCKQEFWAHRSDARFCSAACRKAASRRAATIRQQTYEAIALIRAIGNYVDPDLSALTRASLRAIADVLSFEFEIAVKCDGGDGHAYNSSGGNGLDDSDSTHEQGLPLLAVFNERKGVKS